MGTRDRCGEDAGDLAGCDRHVKARAGQQDPTIDLSLPQGLGHGGRDVAPIDLSGPIRTEVADGVPASGQERTELLLHAGAMLIATQADSHRNPSLWYCG